MMLLFANCWRHLGAWLKKAKFRREIFQQLVTSIPLTCHPLCPGPACPTLQYGLPGEEKSTQYEIGGPGDNQEIKICLAGPQTDAWVKSLEPGHPPRLGGYGTRG